MRFDNDPEYYGMGVEPARKRSKKNKKKGLFSGRVTWVVYLLTTVQFGVFVGELIKNGAYTLRLQVWAWANKKTQAC